MIVTLVATENMHLAWPGMEDAVAEAIEGHGRELTVNSVRDLLFKGELQLWVCAIEMQIFGWAITAVVHYAEMKRLRFLLLGGNNINLWLKHIDAVEQWAAKMDIAEVEAWVRPGLRKKMESFGYAKAYEMVTKCIEKRVES